MYLMIIKGNFAYFSIKIYVAGSKPGSKYHGRKLVREKL